MSDLLTEADLALLLGVSFRALRDWDKRKIGPPRLTIQRTIRYRLSSLEKWLERNESKPRGPASDGR